ncbi:MAG TPA: GntR family transcriptional regulator [Paludibacteraceae bacterium]|jgi:DNA-binding transcriptional regulator YhcF (GntR family)|nr:GntR family transcriptional regulator [Paludibacteraceae bacterium]
MEFNDAQAIYLQIADYISEHILLGKWKEGERLLSVRELATELEVNPNTVMRAYDFLQSNEIIYNKRGIGYFVADDAKEKILNYRRKRFLEKELPILFKNIHLLNIDVEEVKKRYDDYLQKQQAL